MIQSTVFFRDVPTVVLQMAAVVRFLLTRTVAVGASTYIMRLWLKARSATVLLQVIGQSNRTLSPLSSFCQLRKGERTYLSRYRVSVILQRARKSEKGYGKKQ
jgi:hypothetical protein